jgi:uncharacterized protein (DUF1330 family)
VDVQARSLTVIAEHGGIAPDRRVFATARESLVVSMSSADHPILGAVPGWSWVAVRGRMRHANGMPETPVVNCVLLWSRPGREAALSAYEDKVLRLVAEHGGRVLERGTLLPGSQHDGEPPAEVQFLEMPSEASLDAYMNDPRRLAMAAERDAAIARTDLFRIQPVSRPEPEY